MEVIVVAVFMLFNNIVGVNLSRHEERVGNPPRKSIEEIRADSEQLRQNIRDTLGPNWGR